MRSLGWTVADDQSTGRRSQPRAVGVPAGQGALSGGRCDPGAHPRAPAGGRAARHPAPARAPARVHARATLRSRGPAASARTSTARKASTWSRPTAAEGSPTTAPASSSAIRSCGSRTSTAHLRSMEEAIVAALARRGRRGTLASRRGHRLHGRLGAGAQDRLDRRACVARHTTHGFAVNVDNDLEPFSWVIACGLPDVRMTSVAQELSPGHSTGMACIRRRMAFQFCEAHGRRQRLVSPRRIGVDTRAA